ncbi:hypothetical protein VCHA53O466_140206 [Vibrio chagasii]|nr:hypothetical protein VCHA53O466_140206 [Vibrio chagasii]
MKPELKAHIQNIKRKKAVAGGFESISQLLARDNLTVAALTEVYAKHPIAEKMLLTLAKEFIESDRRVDLRMEASLEYFQFLNEFSGQAELGEKTMSPVKLSERNQSELNQTTESIDAVFSGLNEKSLEFTTEAILKALGHPTLIQSFIKASHEAMLINATANNAVTELQKYNTQFKGYFPYI